MPPIGPLSDENGGSSRSDRVLRISCFSALDHIRRGFHGVHKFYTSRRGTSLRQVCHTIRPSGMPAGCMGCVLVAVQVFRGHCDGRRYSRAFVLGSQEIRTLARHRGRAAFSSVPSQVSEAVFRTESECHLDKFTPGSSRGFPRCDTAACTFRLPHTEVHGMRPIKSV